LIGAVAASGIVLTAFAEILITFLPDGNSSPESVIEWFSFFRSNRFLALRNLGLLNIVMTLMGIPIYLALFGAHRKVDEGLAALALLLAVMGTSVFLATNRAFPMLDLSAQYLAAASGAERAALESAGLAMLAVGRSHSPGTFPGFFLSGVAGIIMSAVMLRGKIFGKVAAYFGLAGSSFLLIFDSVVSFAPAFFNALIPFAMAGGLLIMGWYILVAKRLFQGWAE
jgi:hypothetical protein